MATPTEAAATGALGAIVLAAVYRNLTYEVIKKSITGAIHVTVMSFMIIGASQTYSGLLAYTGATRELVNLINSIHMSPLVTLIVMMLILLIMGTFMEQVSMMMITIPVYMPIIQTLGFDPIWFCDCHVAQPGNGHVHPAVRYVAVHHERRRTGGHQSRGYHSLLGTVFIM